MNAQEVCTEIERSAAARAAALAPPVGLISLWAWCDRIGINRSTAWRWREEGVIKASVTIYGRLYLTTDDVQDFETRARQGEFQDKPARAKQPIASPKKKSTTRERSK